jgi:hypothetical protein
VRLSLLSRTRGLARLAVQYDGAVQRHSLLRKTGWPRAFLQDFPKLPILHIDDLVRRKRLGHLPTDIPTIYKPFSIATLTGTVRKLLARE